MITIINLYNFPQLFYNTNHSITLFPQSRYLKFIFQKFLQQNNFTRFLFDITALLCQWNQIKLSHITCHNLYRFIVLVFFKKQQTWGCHLSLVTLTATLTDLCERENASQIEARHRLQGHAKTYVETLEAYITYMVSICPGSVNNGDTVRPWRDSAVDRTKFLLYLLIYYWYSWS